MMSFAALVCGLIVSPSVRSGKLAQPPLSARMCSPQSTGAREPSLLTEISTILEDRCGGMFLEEIRGEMVDAFVLVSGEPAPAAGNFGDKPMPKAEIGLEQLSSTLRGPSLATRARRRGLPEAHHWPFSALLLATGDVLPAEKVQAMFEAVDDNGDGKIEFVKYFKAIMDEVSSRKAASGGGGGGFLAGLLGR